MVAIARIQLDAPRTMMNANGAQALVKIESKDYDMRVKQAEATGKTGKVSYIQDAVKGPTFSADFEVESYLHYQGMAFTDRFDANSYLYITRAIDYFDLTRGHTSLAEALRRTQARYLVMSFSSDGLHPPYQLKQIVSALRATHKHVSYYEVESHYGHDAFLLEREKMEGIIAAFLASGAKSYTPLAPTAPAG